MLSYVASRLRKVEDLVAEEARYHSNCNLKFIRLSFPVTKSETSRKKGSYEELISEVMRQIFDYLALYSNECQFMLTDLIGEFKGEYKPDLRTVKHELMKNYESDIIISRSWRVFYSLFQKYWFSSPFPDAFYPNKSSDEHDATLISEYIRSKIYKTEKYSPINNFLGNAQSIFPYRPFNIFRNCHCETQKRR